MPNRPERMWRKGRPVVPNFEPDEYLYRRCPGGHLQGDIVSDLAIEFPSFSVNRSKYSEPKDVLWGSPERPIQEPHLLGVIAVQVKDVECKLPNLNNTSEPIPSGTTSRDFTVEHLPAEHNYAHSEVRCYRSINDRLGGKIDEPDKKDKPGEVIKKLFRARLAKAARIRIYPQG